MHASSDDGPTPKRHRTMVARTSDRELVVTRWIDGPPRLVFEAWTRPELLQRWWVPKSMGLVLIHCEADVRVGGRYRLVFRFGDAEPMAFFGTYVEVVQPSRLAWTNDEQGDAGQTTTVTFDERDGGTLVTMRELYRRRRRSKRRGRRESKTVCPRPSTSSRRSSPSEVSNPAASELSTAERPARHGAGRDFAIFVTQRAMPRRLRPNPARTSMLP